MTTPTLTAFAAPRGGAGLPWGGPAEVPEMTTPTLTAFAVPRGVWDFLGAALRKLPIRPYPLRSLLMRVSPHE